MKPPVFINTDVDLNKKIVSGKMKDCSNLTYSQQTMQKQATIQFNNSQPVKTNSVMNGCRPFKPVRHRVQVAESAYHTDINDQNRRESSNFKNLLERPSHFSYYPGRQSNLSRNEIEKFHAMDGS
jgi:hypothetical protein